MNSQDATYATESVATNTTGMMTCPLCQFCGAVRDFKETEHHGKVYSIHECRVCTNAFLAPQPDDKTLYQLYKTGEYRLSDGRRFHAGIERVITLFRLRQVRRIKRLKSPGTILDIGCGRGYFLHLMQKSGWTVKGVELNNETASYASDVYGIPVSTSLDFAPESFDVITINHVLEHIPNPLELLAACRELLHPEGILIIAVPNLDSLQSRIGGAAWFHLDIPRHLFHFSENGLRQLLLKHGYRIKGVRRIDVEQDLFGWLQTLLNLSGIRQDLLYLLLKESAVQSGGVKTWSNLLDYLLMVLLLPLYITMAPLLMVFESLTRRSGTIEFTVGRE